MIKKLIRPLLLLLIAAVMLLVLSMGLSRIGESRAAREQAFVFSYLIMDNEGEYQEEPYSGEDSSIQRVFKGDNGYIVEVKVAGYADDIVMWVGVKNDGYVTGLTIRDMDETLGLGRRALTDVPFLLQFLRSEGDAEVGESIDALTGATVSSRAVTRAVNSAVAVVTGADVTSSATTWGN